MCKFDIIIVKWKCNEFHVVVVVVGLFQIYLKYKYFYNDIGIEMRRERLSIESKNELVYNVHACKKTPKKQTKCWHR